MTIATLHTLAPVTVQGTTINQITDINWSPGVQAIVHGASGSVENLFAAAGVVIPSVSFTTTDIAAALAAVTEDGGALTTVGGGLVAWYVTRTEGGSRETTGTKITFADGTIAPTVLSADQSGATLGYAAIARSTDGAISPIAYGTGTCPVVADPANFYVIGDCTINGAALTNVIDASVNFGIGLDARAGNGEIYPTFTGIVSRLPSMVIHTTLLTYVATVGAGAGNIPAGIAPAGTSSVVLDKVAIGGGRTAAQVTVTAGAAEHHVYATTIGATHNGDAVVELVITPVWDGTNSPLIVGP